MPDVTRLLDAAAAGDPRAAAELLPLVDPDRNAHREGSVGRPS
jgi:hypothetical protein